PLLTQTGERCQLRGRQQGAEVSCHEPSLLARCQSASSAALTVRTVGEATGFRGLAHSSDLPKSDRFQCIGMAGARRSLGRNVFAAGRRMIAATLVPKAA